MSKKNRKKHNNNNKNTSKSEIITLETSKSKFEYIVSNIICIIAFLAFGFVAVMSILQTSVIDPENYTAEKILYNWDLIPVNLLLIILFGFVIYKLNKLYGFFAKININYMYIAMAAYVVIIGFLWVGSVNSIPGADSANIFETASQAARNNYSTLFDNDTFYNHDFYGNVSYYSFYPFQLGIVFISEIIYRIFGADSSMSLQYINIICVALSYIAIAKISKLIFKRTSVEFITISLLILCLQPILLSTFAYGNIIGMCCALWASLYLIKYFQTNKYLYFIPCGLLLIIAILAKYNNMIYLVAFAIMLIIHTIKNKKWQSIAFALAIAIASVGVVNLVVLSYENRANTKLRDGISQTMYLNMGLGESSMAPGWFNFSTITIYKDNNFDTKASNEQAKKELSEKINKFISDPGYTLDFFSKKITSQWNEPTYESIWVSKVKGHTTEINGAVESVYNGSMGDFLREYFNQYMQILFIAFATGVAIIFLRKIGNIENSLLLLVLLGAFGYHLLFEGKSQYILTYIILLIPTAAFAINTILIDGRSKIKGVVNKLKKQN
ncbi:MAG: glycosyltransferase family 39 protein [Ruminococcus sp.]